MSLRGTAAAVRRISFRTYGCNTRDAPGKEKNNVEHLEETGYNCAGRPRNAAFQQRQKNKTEGVITQQTGAEAREPGLHGDVGREPHNAPLQNPAKKKSGTPADALEGVIGHFHSVYQQVSGSQDVPSGRPAFSRISGVGSAASAY